MPLLETRHPPAFTPMALLPRRRVCQLAATVAGFFLVALAPRFVVAQVAAAGEPDSVRVPAAGGEAGTAALRVYLDCDQCDFSYIRREVPFVDYVRDPRSAQLHILVTSQGTGGGGRSYRLSFLGRKGFLGQDQDLGYVSRVSDTDDQRREGLTRTLEMGLLRYVSQTPLAGDITIGYTAPEGQREAPLEDPWDHWVFEVGAGGSLDKEALQGSYDFDASLSADRVTSTWKIRTDARLSYDEESVEDDSATIRSASHDTRASLDLVRSLSSRWSAAVFSEVYSRTYTNADLAAELSSGVEYNIFPWDISDRKEFTAAYTAGVRSVRYMEETIYDRTAETRAFASLRTNLHFTQPWGSIRGELEGSHYIPDFRKYQIEFEVDLELRLTRGLSLDLWTHAESIHDQLYLPKGDATLEEILLRRRQLATTYEVESSIGLKYTFGSIYNNVVNPRF